MTSPQLADTLHNGDAASRAAAAQALALMGEAAAPAAVALARLSGDPDAGAWCVAALEEMGPPPPGDVLELIRLLQTADETTAYWAATLLGRLEGGAVPAIEALETAAAWHQSIIVRERAVWALGKIGPAADSARPILEALSASEHDRLARLAKLALEDIG